MFPSTRTSRFDQTEDRGKKCRCRWSVEIFQVVTCSWNKLATIQQWWLVFACLSACVRMFVAAGMRVDVTQGHVILSCSRNRPDYVTFWSRDTTARAIPPLLDWRLADLHVKPVSVCPCARVSQCLSMYPCIPVSRVPVSCFRVTCPCRELSSSLTVRLPASHVMNPVFCDKVLTITRLRVNISKQRRWSL